MQAFRVGVAALATMFFVLTAAAQAPAPASAPAAAKPRGLALNEKKWTFDFDAMLERRMIRVAIPYSRTLFYIDKGRFQALCPSRLGFGTGARTRVIGSASLRRD